MRFCPNRIDVRSVRTIFACCLLMTSFGCSARNAEIAVKADELSADVVLDRCADTYASANSLRAEGRFDDLRNGGTRDVPMTWDYARPARTRLRLGERVVVVRDGAWWRLDPASGAYRSLPGLGGEPMATAGYFVSEGVGLFAVELPERGRAALEGAGNASSEPWRIDGLRWIGERPCYVLRRAIDPKHPSVVRTICIDQDSYLLRGWSTDVVLPELDDQSIVRCEFDRVEINGAVSEARFAVERSDGPAVASAM
jgi:hypothetical protein